jgi:Domain of unknown function (DUF3850)
MGREIKVHELDIWPESFDAIDSGDKTFMILRDDGSNFRVDDTLVLREQDPDTGKHCGRELRRTITYVLSHDAHAGVAEGCR